MPVTGQTFAALLVGAGLGAGRGFLSLALYALVGMAGMPWFANGTSGAGGASFGYVLGMLLASTVVGALARRGADRSVLRTAGTMVLGSAIIYAVGVPYLAASTGMSLSAAVAAGLTPFLLGDALKAALAMGLLPGRVEADRPQGLNSYRRPCERARHLPGPLCCGWFQRGRQCLAIHRRPRVVHHGPCPRRSGTVRPPRPAAVLRR